MRHEVVDTRAHTIVEFCRFVREQGLPGGLHRTMSALRAINSIGNDDREAYAFALRAALCSSKMEWDLFEQLFAAFQCASLRSQTSGADRARKSSEPGVETRGTVSPHELGHVAEAGADAQGEGKAVSGASVEERLKKVDFSEVPQDDLVALEELSLRLLRQMSLRLSRRRRAGYRPGPLDLRRTIRRNLPHGGDLIELAFRNKRPRRHRLVILLDVSGSMNSYSLFLLKFVYALQKHFRQMRAFVFSTSVVEITEALKLKTLPQGLEKLSQVAAGWSAGTKIGESLRELNRLLGRKLRSPDTIFMILSDGWDAGEPEILASQLRAVRRNVRKVIWLNPLLGLAEYEPLTRGMSAALPYIDVFAPAHNLESLLALERHL